MLKEDKENLSLDELLAELDSENFVFGEYLRAVRRAKKISIRQLAKAVNKTPTYLSDIEKGNNKPPEKELLEKIIQELKLDDYQKLKNTLFDLAAKERNDIPADIKEYLMSNKALLQIIRTAQEKPDGEQIWTQMSEKVCGGTKMADNKREQEREEL